MEPSVQNPDRTSLYLQIDGPDGAGKSTLLETVGAWARDHRLAVFDGVAFNKSRGRHPTKAELADVDVLLLGEPTEVNIGAQIRRRLQDTATPHDPRELMELYAADRMEHVRTVVEPFLALGTRARPRTIVQSRGVFSSVAYQPLDGIRMHADPPITPAEVLEQPGNAAALGQPPDLFVFLSVAADVAEKRLAGRHEADLFDGKDFQTALAARYRDPDLRRPLEARGTRFVEIDGNLPKAEVAIQFRRLLEAHGR